MKILVYNDGRGKSQSFHATTERTDLVVGYGQDAQSAIADLKRQNTGLISLLKNITYDEHMMVDIHGEPVQSQAV